jgi:hypothetical protein
MRAALAKRFAPLGMPACCAVSVPCAGCRTVTAPPHWSTCAMTVGWLPDGAAIAGAASPTEQAATAVTVITRRANMGGA